MKIDLQLDIMYAKQRIGMCFKSLVMAIFTYRFMKMINDYVKRQNLKMKTFSQFGGKHQRNLFTVKQNLSYMLVVLCRPALDTGLTLMFELYKEQLDKDNQFIIYNLFWVGYVELFFGIYVPVKHIILSRDLLPGLWWDDKIVPPSNFFVSKPSMSPRRYVKPTTVKIEKNKTSFKILFRNKRVNLNNTKTISARPGLTQIEE